MLGLQQSRALQHTQNAQHAAFLEGNRKAHGLLVSVLAQGSGAPLLFPLGMGESPEPNVHIHFAVTLAYLLCFQNFAGRVHTVVGAHGYSFCLNQAG